ncbi:MAG: 2-oxoacid:ferredoxin oxidoreductase subunit beta [Chloroflexi bacterium]|nr:2-oxoacid:ferredoxin oxidoreductase subunit beta [Chloroflexota bacterium]
MSALAESGLPLDQCVVVSGIGCTGRVAGYVNLDSFHTTHGRAIAFATGVKLANPRLQVTVFSGDGDLFAIGGNHFLHAVRRNTDLLVVCVNNFNYAMTGGQAGPTTPRHSFTTTTPRGATDQPFNLQHLAAALGVVYSARWTALHLRQLKTSFSQALQLHGFRFVEVLSPCPVGFGKANDLGEGIEEMEFYRAQGVVDRRISPAEALIEMSKSTPLPLGVFVDPERQGNGQAGPAKGADGVVGR